MFQKLKSYVPLSWKVAAHRLRREWWREPSLSNPLFGALFDLMGGEFRTDGLSFVIPRDLTTRRFRARFFCNSYERPERELIKKWIVPEDQVIELGACLGIISCATNRQLARPEAHVVVEANPQLIPWIERNRERNGARFTLAHGLLSGTSDGSFYVADLIVGGSRNVPSQERITVPVFDWAGLVEQAAPLEPTALIMDIEGGEVEVLAENRDAIRELRCLIVEMHPAFVGSEAIDGCRKLLVDLGFERVEVRHNVEVFLQRGRAKE